MVNLVVGYVFDLLVCCGVIVMFLEVIEVCDVIYFLMLCVINEVVGKCLLDEMVWYDNYFDMGKIDCSVNLFSGNKKGGLVNVVEKVLGFIVKLGKSVIVEVLLLGQCFIKCGLIYVVMFVSDFVCGMQQVVFGIIVQVFIIGCGMLYGLMVVLVIKMVMCIELVNCWYDLMDINVGIIVMGEEIIEDVGWKLFYFIFDVVSGWKKIFLDQWGLYN